MNMYLAFDHTESHGGYTYYYFRCGLFPSGILEDLLVLASDISISSLLDLPSYTPETLPEDTETSSLDGTPYTVPEDLYLLYIESNPFSSISTPLYDFLDGAISPQSIAVYTSQSGTPDRFPEDFSPEDKPPNVTGASGWYVPELDTKIITIASRKSTSPFWTRGVFDLFSAYGSGEYNCEGLPYNIHVTCNPAEMSVWVSPTYYQDYGVFLVNGYYRNIQSNESTFLGFDLVYNSGGETQSLDGEAYGVLDRDDPVVYFPHLDYSEALPSVNPYNILVQPAMDLLNLLDINIPAMQGGIWQLTNIANLYAEGKNSILGSGSTSVLGSGSTSVLGQNI